MTPGNDDAGKYSFALSMYLFALTNLPTSQKDKIILLKSIFLSFLSRLSPSLRLLSQEMLEICAEITKKVTQKFEAESQRLLLLRT